MSAPGTFPNAQVDLEPADWFLATWRRLAPLPAEETPFDLNDALARLDKLTTAHADSWDRAALNPAMSPFEARFWYEAISLSGPAVQPCSLTSRLRRGLDHRPLGRPEVFSRLNRNTLHLPPHIVIPLARLLSPLDVVEIATSPDLGVVEHNRLVAAGAFRRGIQRFLIPYLTPEQLDPLRERLRERLQGLVVRPRRPLPDALLLAGAFGLHADLDPVVSGWPDDFFRGSAARPESRAQWVVFGLGGPDAVRHHVRRLGLRLVETRHVHAWLAHTELADLGFIRESVLACTSRSGAEWLLDGFSLVNSPAAAPLMLELMVSSKAPARATAWFQEGPARASAGLAALAGGRGKLAEAAQQVLRDLARVGHAEEVEAALQGHGAAGRILRAVAEPPAPPCPPFGKEDAPAWLLQAAAEQLGGRPRPLPRWITPEHLPPLRIQGRRLDATQVHAAINALRDSTLERQAPLVTLLKERAEPASRDAFAWEVFTRWLSAGAPSQDRWALLAVGLWGTDASVVKLAPMVRNWPAQKQTRRAELGLACLRAIGTETALLELSGIAQKVRFRKLRQTASGFILQIAGERKLSTAQLEDRIVPHLGLDARGTRVFDFGPRKFRLVLGQHLKPLLLDEADKVRADLPKPGVHDDPAKATQAVGEWKTFKKQIREVLKVQQARLESAMLSGRRWSAREFETWIVRHPLMGLLAQGVLWGALDEQRRLGRTFRVTEDRSFVDRTEAPCSLAGTSGVFIVHPLHLGDGERAAWRETFLDHELLTTFPQLSRPVYLLPPGEAGLTVLRRYDGRPIPSASLLGVLERFGWDRGRSDALPGRPYEPLVTSHRRYFHSADVTAVLCYRGGVPSLGGFRPDWPDQVLDGCFFVPGLQEPPGGFRPDQAIPLGKVDPIVLSEVLSVLETLASKAG
jgi:hypothetical protein